MGIFAISKCSAIFATVLGSILSIFNFYVVFQQVGEITWWQIILGILFGSIYIGIIISAIWEPTKDLTPIIKNETNSDDLGELSVDHYDEQIKSSETSTSQNPNENGNITIGQFFDNL